VISCIIAASGVVLMFKFPEMNSLGPGLDPLSLTVLGLSIKFWKAAHVLASLLFIVLSALHIYFNRDWIKKVGSKRLSLNMVVGLLIGVSIILVGVFAPSALP
jgi:hypothetical protein